MEEFNELDELFKDGLQNAQITPPPGVWESIASTAAASASTAVSTAVWIVAAKWVAGSLAAAAVSWFGYQYYQSRNVSGSEQRELQQTTVEKERQGTTQDNGENAVREKENIAARKELQPTKPDLISQNQRDISESGINPEKSDHTADRSNQVQEGTSINSNSAPKPVLPPKHVQPPSQNNPAPIVHCSHTMSIQSTRITDYSYTFQVNNARGNLFWNFNDGKGYGKGNESVTYDFPSGINDNYVIRALSIEENGCRDSARFALTIDLSKPFIPDYLTPNGDGVNDDFYISSLQNPAYFDLTIFDLNNRPVFHTDNANAKWNGMCGAVTCPAGRYRLVLVYRRITDKDPVKVNKPIELIRE